MKTCSKIILAMAALLSTACNNKKDEIQPVCGTIDGPVNEERAPQKVQLAMTLPYQDRYENILDDRQDGIGVWSLIWCNPDIPSEGYGIHITKDGKATHFPDIYHGKNPRAEYYPASGFLWLFCGAIEGTGVHVEKPYLFRFDEGGSARTVAKLDPYTIQQALCDRLGYKIEGQDICLYDNGTPLCTVTNTITDMGGLDEEQPVWIGEQLSYSLRDGDLYLSVTPGVKFTTGLVLAYDDMPTLDAKVSVDENGFFKIGAIDVAP